MRKTTKRLITVVLAVIMLTLSVVLLTSGQNVTQIPSADRVFTPSVQHLRIGIFYGNNALPSANLQNVNGAGRGFDFGYFENGRTFVPIGAWTNETQITMIMDRNMVWNQDTREYTEGTSGAVVVGVFHIQLNTSFGTFDEARAAADQFTRTHAPSFVKFEAGQFFVSVGNYTSRAAAEEAMGTLGLSGQGAVNAGTRYTVTVVRTGTNTILFEFDWGRTQSLGIMPRPIGNENPETWFRGHRYNGGFEYSRRDGAEITVVNVVAIEDYIKGVVPYEMSPSWPLQALKAQAVTARTFGLRNLNRHRTHGFDLCTLEHCQVYRGRNAANDNTDQSVRDTAGVFVTYNGRLVETFYASSNGGASENSENVWVESRPYLVGVIDPFEADVAHRIPGYRWTITFTPEQITQRLRERGHNVGRIVHMEVSQYSPTGNVISVRMRDENGRWLTFSRRGELITALGVRSQRFDIGVRRWEGAPGASGDIYINEEGQRISADGQQYVIGGDGAARAVDIGGMYAITGTGEVERVTGGGGGSPGNVNCNGMINGVFTITGTGNGHNVGMSQWGAYSMARFHGKTYVEIIQFYFRGVTVG